MDITLVGSFLGFIGGFLSFIAGYQVYYDKGLGYQYKTWKYDQKMKKAIKEKKKKDIKDLQQFLPAVKIYSTDLVVQAAAIEELHSMAIDEIDIIQENIKKTKISTSKNGNNNINKNINKKENISSQKAIIDFAFGTLVKRSGDRPEIHKQCEEPLSSAIKDICGRMKEIEIVNLIHSQQILNKEQNKY
jgi:hypothetical protein